MFYRELFFDEESNLLDETPKDPMEVEMRKKILESRNKFEDLIRMAKNSEEGMDFLYSSLSNLVEPLQKITPAMRLDKQDEYESFFGNKIPNHSHKCTISSQHSAQFQAHSQAELHKINFVEKHILFIFIVNTQVHYTEGTIAIANTSFCSGDNQLFLL